MPRTKEELERLQSLLSQHGINPEEVDKYITPEEYEKAKLFLAGKEAGPATAVGLSASENIIPALSGIGTGALILGLFPEITIPALLLSLAGGAGAAGGTKALQEYAGGKALGEKWSQYKRAREASRLAYPELYTGTEIATSLIASGKLSPSQLLPASSGALKVATSKIRPLTRVDAFVPTQVEKEALKQAGRAFGTMGAIDIGMQEAENIPKVFEQGSLSPLLDVSIPRALGTASGGLLFSRPRAYQVKLSKGKILPIFDEPKGRISPVEYVDIDGKKLRSDEFAKKVNEYKISEGLEKAQEESRKKSPLPEISKTEKVEFYLGGKKLEKPTQGDIYFIDESGKVRIKEGVEIKYPGTRGFIGKRPVSLPEEFKTTWKKGGTVAEKPLTEAEYNKIWKEAEDARFREYLEKNKDKIEEWKRQSNLELQRQVARERAAEEVKQQEEKLRRIIEENARFAEKTRERHGLHLKEAKEVLPITSRKWMEKTEGVEKLAGVEGKKLETVGSPDRVEALAEDFERRLFRAKYSEGKLPEKPNKDQLERQLKMAERAGVVVRFRVGLSNLINAVEKKRVVDAGKPEEYVPRKYAGRWTIDSDGRRVIELDPLYYSSETIPHEIVHSYIDALRNSPNNLERRFAEKIIKTWAGTIKDIKRATKEEIDEESLAINAGKEFMRRIEQLEEMKLFPQLKLFWKEFKAAIKNIDDATPRDLMDVLLYRMSKGPKYTELYGAPKVVIKDLENSRKEVFYGGRKYILDKDKDGEWVDLITGKKFGKTDKDIKKFIIDGAGKYVEVDGVDAARAFEILAATGKKSPDVVVRESLQNAYDSVSKSGKSVKRISTFVIHGNETVYACADNGTGMLPEDLVTYFLRLFASDKTDISNVGKYGVAKASLLGSEDCNGWRVITYAADKDGKIIRSVLEGSPETWKEFVKNGYSGDLSKPGTYKLADGLTLTVSETPMTETGFIYAARFGSDFDTKNHMSGQAQMTLANLDDIKTSYVSDFFPGRLSKAEMESMFFNSTPTINEAINFKSQYNELKSPTSAAYAIHRVDKNILATKDIPGASVEIRGKTEPVVSGASVDVFVNDLYQFTIYNTSDVYLPKNLNLNVIPKVDVFDKNYPFYLDRNEFRGAMAKEFSDLATAIDKILGVNISAQFDAAMSSARIIATKGSRNLEFLSISPIIPSSHYDWVASQPTVKGIALIFFDVFNKMRRALVKFYPEDFKKARFYGLISNATAYGVRFGKLHRGSSSKIYIDPFAIAKGTLEEIAGTNIKVGPVDLFCADSLGVLSHELAHQLAPSSEGQSHSRALTRVAGMLLSKSRAAGNLLRKRIEELGGTRFLGELANIYDITEKYTVHDFSRSLIRNKGGSPYGIDASVFRRSQGDIAERISPSYRSRYQTAEEGTGETRGIVESVSEIRRKYEEHTPIAPFRLISSVSDKLRYIAGDNEIDRKSANYFSNKFEMALADERRLSGELSEPVFRVVSNLGLTKKEDRILAKYRYEMREFGKSDLEDVIKSNPKLSLLDDLLTENYANWRELANELGVHPAGRLANINPQYEPHIISHTTRRIVTERRNSEEAKKLLKDLEDRWVEKAKKDNEFGKITNHNQLRQVIRDEINTYIRALAGDFSKSEAAQHFAALRRAEGWGLPESWVDPSAVSRFMRYSYRAAKDLAFFKHIENDPVARGIAGIPDQFGLMDKNAIELPDGTKISNVLQGTKELKNALDVVTGDKSDIEAIVMSASRAVAASWLGTYSGIRDFITSFTFDVPYMKLSQMPIFVRGLLNLRNAWENSFLYGVNKSRINALEFGAESINHAADTFNRVADIAAKSQGRQQLEQVTRALQFSYGYLLAKSHLFNPTSSTSKRFLALFAKDIDNLQDYLGRSNVPEDVLNKIAANFVEANQGTYDARGLPKAAISGTAAPFLALSRWNIEKANRMYKDIIVPLIEEKDPMPLLKATLGAVLGGAVLRHVGEVITNKLYQQPTKKEALTKDRKDMLVYEITTSMNMAGYFGVYSQFIGDLWNVAEGNARQGVLTFPLYDFVVNNLFFNISNYALADHEDVYDATIKLIDQIMYDLVQAYRIVANHTVRRDEIEYKNKLRDLRVFRRLDGSGTTLAGRLRENVIADISGKAFDRAPTVEEAMKHLPKAVDYAIRKETSREYPSVKRLVSSLSNVAETRYSTIPIPRDVSDIDTMLELARYLDFIEQTKGPGSARRLIEDFLRRSQINEQKEALAKAYILHRARELVQ